MRTVHGSALGFGIAATLAGLIGLLGALHALAPDPEALRAQFEQKLDELDRAAEENPVSADALAEGLLAEEPYREHVRPLYLKLDRRHAKLHAQAQIERAAEQAVSSFLRRCPKDAALSDSDLQSLSDEARALLDSYGGTRQSRRIRQARERLESLGLSRKCSESTVFLSLTDSVLKSLEAGEFAVALGRIEEFRRQFPKRDEFGSQLSELEGRLRRKAKTDAAQLLAQAQADIAGRATSKAVSTLESALGRYTGLPEHAEIESLLRRLRPR